MADSGKSVLLDVNDQGIALLTINRPEKLNALNSSLLGEIDRAFADIKAGGDVKGVIITGSGEKAFVAGADIQELKGLNKVSGKDASMKGQHVFQKIEDFPMPVIAFVNGYALGGGAELAMACHLRVATENAVFGLPEVSLGLIPGYGGTQRLARLIGRAKALELILTGGQIKAEEAKSLGLVNRVVRDINDIGEVKEIMANILKNGPLAIAKAIKAVNASVSEMGFEREAELFGELCETEDAAEGTSAFLEKRKPEFSGK